MTSTRKDIWHEGFAAGQVLGNRCRYPSGSPEAQAWEKGWTQGALQRTGAGDCREEPSATGWRHFIRWIFGG